MSNAVARIDFDRDQLEIIKRQFFPTKTSEQEMAYCLAVARELGLNPITREIFFIARRSKENGVWKEIVSPLVGRDGFIKLASKVLAGIETTTELKEVPTLVNGKWELKLDLVATCKAYKVGSSQPYVTEACYREYCQINNDGQPTKFWSEKPATMLKKVAESQCLRKLAAVHGVYAVEEVNAGMITDGGELILAPDAIEADFTPHTDKPSHLSVVPPQQTERQVSHPSQDPPHPERGYETSWPEEPPEEAFNQQTTDSVANEIIALLEGRNITYEIDRQNGTISAKSYNERQLLKDSGFKWHAETKSWVFSFEPEPF